MKLLLDMNLSPAWIDVLHAEGWETAHWQEVGATNAPDVEIMAWAKENGYSVLTNDLDFTAILAATRAEGPSVVQIRAQDLAPETLKPALVRDGTTLTLFDADLEMTAWIWTLGGAYTVWRDEGSCLAYDQGSHKLLQDIGFGGFKLGVGFRF